MRIPVFLMTTSCLLLLFFGVFAMRTPESEAATTTVTKWGPVSDPTEVYGDPLPQTLFDPDENATEEATRIFPQPEDVKLIGRLSEGVIKVAKRKGSGRWWHCGKTVKEEDEADLALQWAYRIAYLAWDYSDDATEMNAWGIFGVAANESGFDQCALGPWPRKWGYQHKTIKRRKLCISHPYDEIKATMLHPKGIERWNTIGLDAAPLHQLWRCNKNGMCRPKFNREGLPPIPLDEVFSLGKGFEYNVRKLKKDAIDFHTDRPWLYWPGYRADWYDKKIVKWARIGGATDKEI